MADDLSKPHWYRLTPDRFVIGLLVVECLLWLSERFRWFTFNEHKGWTVLTAIAIVGVAGLLMLLWFAGSLIFQRRFQFSVRSLFVLVLDVAIPCGWLAAATKEARKQSDVAREIEKFGASVQYDYRFDSEWVLQENAIRSGPAWLRDLLGDDFFMNVVFVNLSGTRVTNSELEYLKGLPHLGFLQLNDTKINDAGLERLKGLTRLQMLFLDDTSITDAGLEQLKALTQLQALSLDRTSVTDDAIRRIKEFAQLQLLSLAGTKITDVGLNRLQGLVRLEELRLDETQVSDAGLEQLRGLTHLQMLGLEGTKVTADGVAKFQHALPNCQIRL